LAGGVHGEEFCVIGWFPAEFSGTFLGGWDEYNGFAAVFADHVCAFQAGVSLSSSSSSSSAMNPGPSEQQGHGGSQVGQRGFPLQS